MKKFIDKIKENKTMIIKMAIMLGTLVTISLITVAILMATGLLSYGEEGFVFDSHMFDSFRDKWYGFIVFILVMAVLSILLCAIPGVAMALVVLSQVIYPDSSMEAFLLSYAGILVSSTMLYITGRLGGYKLCEIILGKEDCEKSLSLLKNRGTIYFPIMMLFPIFPDDALVMIAGTTKMKLSWFIPSIVLCRGVGAATIIFGMNIIPFETFVLYDWLIFLTVVFFWVKEIFKLASKLDKYFDKKRKEKLAKQEISVEDGEPIAEEV